MDPTQPQPSPSNGGFESQGAQITYELPPNLVRFNERALEVIRERPLASVLGAVALGYIVGKIAARY